MDISGMKRQKGGGGDNENTFIMITLEGGSQWEKQQKTTKPTSKIQETILTFYRLITVICFLWESNCIIRQWLNLI